MEPCPAASGSGAAVASTRSSAGGAALGLSVGAAARIRSALDRVNELWDGEEAVVAARAEKRSASKATAADKDKATIARSCSNCRRIKAKCISATAPGQACVRCGELALNCIYPEARNRGPKKRLSKTQRLLQIVKRDLEAVLAGHGALDPLDEGSDDDDASPTGNSVGDDDDRDTRILRNPLAFLANTAVEANAMASQAQSYHDGALYRPRPETSDMVEPVHAGLLAVSDLRRLVKLFFDKLYPFFFLLIAELHTPDWLRLNSPFLCTTLAYVSSTFDPLSAHLTEGLKQHTLQYASHILAKGLKSLEITQAFYFLSHWSSPTADFAEDQCWAWLWEAIRMSTELRLDVLIDGPTLNSYRWGLSPTHHQLELLSENRKRTWSILFCGRLAMSVQTGRFDCSGPPALLTGPHAAPTSLPDDHPDYSMMANLAVNTIQTRALTLASGLHEEQNGEGLRDAFMSFWKPEIEAWRLRWPNVNVFIDIHAENIVIMLSLVGLRFKGGSPHPVLTECKAAALRTVEKVISWEDRITQILFASNYVIWHIAYGAVLLLQLALRFQQSVPPDLSIRCLRVATILEQIGRNRPNATSYATVHAARIRSLCESAEPSRSDSPLPSILAGVPHNVPPQPPTWPLPPQLPRPPTAATATTEPPPLTAAFPQYYPPARPSASVGGEGEQTHAGSFLPELDWGIPTGAMDFLDMSMQDPTLSWLWSDPGGVGGAPSGM
ncbi:hypothetical protein JCM3770_006428 [Rhodotorula araucariae]